MTTRIAGFNPNPYNRNAERSDERSKLVQELNLLPTKDDPFKEHIERWVRFSGPENGEGVYLGMNERGVFKFTKVIEPEYNYSNTLDGETIGVGVNQGISSYTGITSMKPASEEKVREKIRQANACIRARNNRNYVPDWQI